MIIRSKLPPPAPKNRSKPSIKFDFDSDEEGEEEVVLPEKKFNQTSKNY